MGKSALAPEEVALSQIPLLPPGSRRGALVVTGRDAGMPGAPPWLPPGSSPRPGKWAYSPPATCLRWARRCGRGARSSPRTWPPRVPKAGAPTDLLGDAPPRTPCACSPWAAALPTGWWVHFQHSLSTSSQWQWICLWGGSGLHGGGDGTQWLSSCSAAEGC